MGTTKTLPEQQRKGRYTVKQVQKRKIYSNKPPWWTVNLHPLEEIQVY
jgi:hypothetical protein